jgi:hypothetical protein
MINLLITGNLKMEVVNLHTGEAVDEKEAQEVSDKLQKGEYIISIHDQVIAAANNPTYGLCKFIIHGDEAEFDYED